MQYMFYNENYRARYAEIAEVTQVHISWDEYHVNISEVSIKHQKESK